MSAVKGPSRPVFTPKAPVAPRAAAIKASVGQPAAFGSFDEALGSMLGVLKQKHGDVSLVSIHAEALGRAGKIGDTSELTVEARKLLPGNAGAAKSAFITLTHARGKLTEYVSTVDVRGTDWTMRNAFSGPGLKLAEVVEILRARGSDVAKIDRLSLGPAGLNDAGLRWRLEVKRRDSKGDTRWEVLEVADASRRPAGPQRTS